MAVLIIRLQGPMQSWGTQSRFSDRDTGKDPSRSGLIGLLCCALGWGRGVSLEPFYHIKMATRVDHEGSFSTDFQTSLNVAKANGNSGDTVISRKHFLADASFTVALAGDYEFLNKLHLALDAPVWPLFLGRKAFVPGVPPFVKDGLLKDLTDPLEALKAFPLDKKRSSGDTISSFRFVVECPEGAEIRNDFPLSFEPRNFASRRVSTLFINIKG